MAADGVEFHPKIGVFCVISVSYVVLQSDSLLGLRVTPDHVTKTGKHNRSNPVYEDILG